jgi:hypothetical protein
MITQKIKNWLSKLFAWWPWRRSASIDVTHHIGNVNTGMTQEQTWRALSDGPMSQPGIMSVAVEQGKEEPVPENNRFSIDERIERFTQKQLPGADEKTGSPHNPSAETAREPSSSRRDIPAPTQEQQLAFLRYLVKRGIVNEGFPEGQAPEQYKQK